jgi:hypothetical protein
MLGQVVVVFIYFENALKPFAALLQNLLDVGRNPACFTLPFRSDFQAIMAGRVGFNHTLLNQLAQNRRGPLGILPPSSLATSAT